MKMPRLSPEAAQRRKVAAEEMTPQQLKQKVRDGIAPALPAIIRRVREEYRGPGSFDDELGGWPGNTRAQRLREWIEDFATQYFDRELSPSRVLTAEQRRQNLRAFAKALGRARHYLSIMQPYERANLDLGFREADKQAIVEAMMWIGHQQEGTTIYKHWRPDFDDIYKIARLGMSTFENAASAAIQSSTLKPGREAGKGRLALDQIDHLRYIYRESAGRELPPGDWFIRDVATAMDLGDVTESIKRARPVVKLPPSKTPEKRRKRPIRG